MCIFLSILKRKRAHMSKLTTLIILFMQRISSIFRGRALSRRKEQCIRHRVESSLYFLAPCSLSTKPHRNGSHVTVTFDISFTPVYWIHKTWSLWPGQNQMALPLSLVPKNTNSRHQITSKSQIPRSNDQNMANKRTSNVHLFPV